MTQRIEFWSTRGTYGPFSNFSKHSVTVGDLVYPTSEHYYQAMKFEGQPRAELIRLTPSAWDAAQKGRDPAFKMREDWDELVDPSGYLVKDVYMLNALTMKFTQHRALYDLLLSTGELEIVEASPKDAYWGYGPDKLGKNMLGKLLMALRKDLRFRELARQGLLNMDAPDHQPRYADGCCHRTVITRCINCPFL